jgi:hypothetical protein
MNDSNSRKKGKGKGCRGLAALVAVGGLAGCASAPAVTASSAAALCQLAHSRLPTDAPEKAAEALAKCSDPAYIEPWLEEFDDVKALVKAQRAGKPRP